MITRKISPKGRSVRVTFALPEKYVHAGAAIAGNFNDWSVTAHAMKLDKKRRLWTRSISFKPGETVEFRYFVDGSRWVNDDEADATAATPFFSENSVLIL